MQIEITELQALALSYVAVDPEEWARIAVENRARVATDEIVKIYVDRALNENVSIPSDRDAILRDAFTRGWVKTAAERNAAAQDVP